jgi:O-acetyl-ADP-ribose deacetylase (regulator of RNase III)
MWEALKGKKTYLLLAALVVHAVTGVVTGNLTPEQALAMILASGALASLRHALSRMLPPQ